jgi:hypothetical protein
VGTSVFRAFLLFAAPLPIYENMACERKPPKDVDSKLDEALDETFPASDPVAVGRNDHPGKPASSPPDDKDA